MELKKELGKRIQLLRNQRNITQEQLGVLIGIDSKNISKIENGKNYPSPETLNAIAKSLNVEIFELFLFKREIFYEEMKNEIIKELENKSSVFYLYKMVLDIRKTS